MTYCFEKVPLQRLTGNHENNVSKVSCLSMKPLFKILLSPFLAVALTAITSCSARPPAGALLDGHLRPCPNSPNCLNSEQEGRHATEPLPFSGSVAENRTKLEKIIGQMGGALQSSQDNYLWATFTSRILRFVDDLELRFDVDKGIIHVRSGSRVGYSDFGVNAKRVAELRRRFLQEQSSHNPS